jgi:alkanesulfonate monooxygenase SsuD/methylene tetrahydromethanopterin reductase-like flavin-dependent oxidoreductase (luciferase family)
MSLRVGLSTPFDFWELSPDDQRARLAHMADAGIDHVFTADHVSFFDGSGMDALIHLAVMGGMEPRLGLHAGVYLLALRHPMVAARKIASLAQALPGRLTVGVGVGGEDRHEVEVCEVDPATRGKRTDVALRLVRALLRGETVDGDGRFYRFSKGRIRPTPDPAVPFVVGGRSDAAVRRTGHHGDGWLATWCSPGRFATGIAMAEDIAAELGRTVRWHHGLQSWLGAGATVTEARGHVARMMEGFYKIDFSAFEKYTPVGGPEQIAERLAPYVEAGAQTLNLTPCGPDPESEIETVAEVKRLLIS